MKNLKKIPKFQNETEERNFWLTNDSTEYVNYSHLKKVTFSNLKPTTKTISLRVPEFLLDQIRKLANKKDVPYQSLIKVFLAEKVNEENFTLSKNSIKNSTRY